MNINEILKNLDVWSNAIPILGFIITIIIFRVSQKKKKEIYKKLANREVYLKLELASIDLFRFEATDVEIIRPIWQANIEMPKKGTAEYLVIMNYVCQILNLFELAIKFRQSKDKILPPDLFSSWVAWFHSLATAPGFQYIWDDIHLHYIIDLRNIMYGGIRISKENSNPKIVEEKFYEYVSFALKCKIIKHWTSENEHKIYNNFRKSEKKELTSKSQYKIDSTIEINWIRDTTEIEEYVDFFIKNTTENYISHGEIQFGRATSANEWSKNLKSKLISDFNTVVENEKRGNLISAHTQDNILVGLILLEYFDSPNGVYATLADIVVADAYRKNGIGNQMVNWVFKEVEKKNITNLYAESNINNISAHNFLTKHGFNTISKVLKKDLKVKKTAENRVDGSAIK